MAAEGDEPLLLAPREVEAFGHRRRTGRILRFEDLDGRVGGHHTAPGILHELLGVLRHGHQAQVTLARPAREGRQELPTCGMLHERGRLVNVERTRRAAVVERLRPDAVGDKRDRECAQFTAHVADIPHHQVACEIDRGLVREQAGQAAGDVAIQPTTEVGFIWPAEAALQDVVEVVCVGHP